MERKTLLKSKQLDLFRHGEPELTGVYLGRTDAALSAHGKRFSLEALSKNPGWDLVVSSPLRRCLETARDISQQLGVELLVIDRLQEYDFGDWDGQQFEVIYAQQSELADRFWLDPETNPPPSGESITQFIDRVELAKSLLLEREEKRILVITHGGVIRSMVANLLGVQPNCWGRIKVDYSHFTQLRFEYDLEQCWSQLISSNVQSPL